MAQCVLYRLFSHCFACEIGFCLAFLPTAYLQMAPWREMLELCAAAQALQYQALNFIMDRVE